LTKYLNNVVFRQLAKYIANDHQTQIKSGKRMLNRGKGVDEPRFMDGPEYDAVAGEVSWNIKKSLWISLMYIGMLAAFAFYFTLQHFLVFVLSSALVLCFGHSLGMHRRLIHGSYDCPKWLEYLWVYMGSLVGLGGPFTMIYTHDIRDWAQRKAHCHDYFAHRQGFFRDAWWQMHCEVALERAPQFAIESHLKNDRFYQFIEKTWMWQQVPWAILLFMCGGWAWVLWGICTRVAVCVTGHWLIGYFAHRTGHRDWHVEGAGVQGYNIKFAGLITFGECWHNNHHAFPGSAKLGLKRGQLDPGWWVLCF